MRYMGGKDRLSKNLCTFINENYLQGNEKPFVDLFCGGCSIISKIDNKRKRFANDKHKYLIAMWKELQKGWIPPKNCSREQFYVVKSNMDYKPYVSGFIGFGCSFGGRWFEDSAYAQDKSGRNYCLNAHNSVLKKLEGLKDVTFTNLSYDEVYIPQGSIVYCDKPYENTTPYCKRQVGEFDHDKFWQWVRENSDKYTILISEFKSNIPNDFDIVWVKQTKQNSRNIKNEHSNVVEVLVTYNKKEGNNETLV